MKHHFRAQHGHDLGRDQAWKDQEQVLGAVARQLWVPCFSDPPLQRQGAWGWLAEQAAAPSATSCPALIRFHTA